MDDASIVRMFLDRDTSAPAQAQKAYGGYLRTVAMNVLGDPGDAAECVNDALLQAWRSIPPNEPRDLGAYLARITRNTALNRLKQRGRQRPAGAGAEQAFDELSGVLSGGSDPEEAYRLCELTEAINSFLELQPPSERRLFVDRYFYYDELSVIAKRAGRSSNYVSVHLMRLRKKLANYLTERGFSL